MEVLVFIGIALFLFVTSVIMPWVNNGRVNSLQQKINYLENIIRKFQEGERTVQEQDTQEDLFQENKKTAKETSQPLVFSEVQKKETIEKIEPVKKTSSHTHRVPEVPLQKPQSNQQPKQPKQPKQSKQPKSARSFEEQFGTRLPVWIGGIALILAGFFLVKYTIDIGLLTPKVRLVLGGMFGAGLIYLSNWIRSKPHIANGVRIAQSLSGAGVVLLYIVVYAATTLYGFLPSFVGFIGMTAVTITGVVLSLRHGYPIAIMALIGGFLTPALISTGNHSALMLFAYLYFIFSGFLFVIRKNEWWFLSVPTLLFAFLWVIVWLGAYFTPSDSIWLGLFLIGICGSIIFNLRKENIVQSSTLIFLNYIGIGGAVILMGIVSASANLGFIEWGLFGLIAGGGIVLAYFDNKSYGFIPLLSMIVNAIMLLSWNTQNYNTYCITLVVFASIYIGSGYFIMKEFRFPVKWARLMGITGIAYYLIAYDKLYTHLFINIPFFWGLISLVLASATVFIIQEIRTDFQESKIKDYLLAIFAITATAFISLGLAIEIDKEFLPLAFACQIFGIAWVNSRFPMPALRSIIVVLLCLFGFLLSDQIALMIRLGMYSLLEIKLGSTNSIPFVDNPIIQLGLPAIAFIGSVILLLKEKDGKLIWALEMATVALLGVMFYYITRNTIHAGKNVLFIKAGFFERGIVTNVLFIASIVCFFVGRKLERISFFWSGLALFAISAFRIIYFDILIYNPLLANQNVGNLPILNFLFITYGIPILWTIIGSKELGYFNKDNLARYTKGFTLILLFLLVSFNVRQFFHGEILYREIITSAEIYSYSVAWLLTGIGLLVIGIMRESKMVRLASLGMMILVVGKVFLYDASELEGLYRVFSFFGLGLCLIGLSYFYTRFVFKK